MIFHIFSYLSLCVLYRKRKELYMIAINRRIFLGSILDDFWCRVRTSEVSAAFDPSFLAGAVTGRVGKALDQKGSNALRNLWWNGPTLTKRKIRINKLNQTSSAQKTKESQHEQQMTCQILNKQIKIFKIQSKTLISPLFVYFLRFASSSSA